MKRWFFLLLPLIIIFLTPNGRLHAQSSSTQQHLVQPGDTWQALSRRYGISQDVLRAAYPHPNLQSQPVIGNVLQLPDTGREFTGRLLRLNEGGLLATAVLRQTSPWQLATLNGLPHPYRPTLYSPLFIPGGTEPPRELPVGFETLELSQLTPQPGQALAFRAMTSQPISITAQLDGMMFASFGNGRHHVSLIGIDDFYHGRQPELTIQPSNQPLWSQPWRFVDGDWTYNQITLTGTAAAITQEQIREEHARLSELWSQKTPSPQWTTGFRLPITDYLEISSLFGARRSYNGGPYNSSHEGVDFSAYGGTAVYAPAAGTVILAEPLTVRGNAVIIDHGLGVYTGVYHLSALSVEAGQIVETGRQVGAVGTTGFSTGNHLHWDTLIAGQWVDGLAWVEQNMACWILEGWGKSCANN
ncbi:MAG: LysM peptidoglycan-binding domain-containing M23 family metallopeptidase [Chloroflexi bacterium]|nr:LysM peptidoglycan-binding domain-containing M23 family metallopeptidase [Chloroflexota bacterium]